MSLDIFKLHVPEIDRNPKSWICVKGKNLKQEIKKAMNLLRITRRQLARILSKNLSYSLTPSEKVVYFLKEWIPLVVIEEILDTLKKEKNLPEHSLNKISCGIINSIEFFRVNTLGSKPVKLPHELNTILCKIAGAHAADGTLIIGIEVRSKNKESIKNFLKNNYPIKKFKINFNKHIRTYNVWLTDYNFLDKFKGNLPKDIRFSFLYHFRLVDEYKESVEKFAEWFDECFGLKLQVRKHPKENDYFVCFQNKVIGRYFTEILKFQGGNKTRTVKEPEVIKSASINLRKAFALGVMSFDGCVELDGTISLNTFSVSLLQSVLDIILKDPKCPISLKNKIIIRKGRLRTLKSLTSSEYVYLSNVFEPRTEKWYKVLEFADGYKGKIDSLNSTLKVLDATFPLKWYKVSLSHIIKVFQLNNLEGFFIIEDLVQELKNKNNLKKLGRDIVTYRLKLLERMNIIKSVKYRDITGKRVTGMKKAYIFNPKINSWRIPYRPWLKDLVELS